jgi:glucose-1-phosphate thymidylyltransferase
MKYIEDAKRLCLERDALRCRHCGTTDDLDVMQLVKREGRLAWQLSNLITLCSSCLKKTERNIENHNPNRVGVILAGGKGTRLYPLTKFQNKHTLAIGLNPIIFYPLKTLREFGIKRVLVVMDREGADQIVAMLGSGKEFGMDVSYKVQEGAGGISEALYLAKDFVDESTTEVVVILGDNIFDSDGLDTSELFEEQPNLGGCSKYDARVYLKKVDNPSDYGIAVLDENNKIKTIVEKPKDFIGDLAVVGLYIYSPCVFDEIENIHPSDRGGSIQRYAEACLHGAKQANVSKSEIDDFVSIVFDEK